MAKLYLDLEDNLMLRSEKELKELMEKLVYDCAMLLCAANDDNVDLFSEVGHDILYVHDILNELKQMDD